MVKCRLTAGQSGLGVARHHDAALELEDADQRRERWAHEMAAQEACRQLGEAMGDGWRSLKLELLKLLEDADQRRERSGLTECAREESSGGRLPECREQDGC